MVKNIVTYPNPPSAEYSTDIRIFNEELYSLIDDLKDTIEANNLEGLAAFQIKNHFNVVVVKQSDGSFLELINPRLISNKGKITTRETTAYFPGLSAEVTRYDKISIIYQDREGNDLSLKAEGDFSILLQRKLDYTFGSSFLNKLSGDAKKEFELQLEYGAEAATAQTCPTTFKRDYFKKGVLAITVIMALLAIVGFFLDAQLQAQIWSAEVYLFIAAIAVNIGYFFYGYYEGKKYSSCTSCQIGNIIGTFTISLVRLLLVFGVAYLLI